MKSLLLNLVFFAISSLTEAQSVVQIVERSVEQLVNGVNFPPVSDSTGMVEITIRVVFVSIDFVDDTSDSLGLSVSIMVEWPTGLNNLKLPMAIVKPQDNMWTPKLVVTNCLNLADWRSNQEKASVDIDFNGTAHWKQYNQLHLACSLDLLTYPFDIQICEISITPLVEHNIVKFTYPQSNVSCISDAVVDNPQWQFLGSRYEITSDPKSAIPHYRSRFVLKRRSDFYEVTTIIPAICLVITAASIFITPSDCGEKMNISCTVLLSFFVVLAGIANTLPPISDVDKMPILYWLVFGLFVSTAFAALWAAFIARMATIPDEIIRKKMQSVERFLKNCKKLVRCKKHAVQSGNKTEPAPFSNSHGDDNTGQQQHAVTNAKRLTKIVDVVNRISLVIYAIVISVVCLTILYKYLSELQERAPRYNDAFKSTSFFLRDEQFFAPSTTASTAC